MLVMLRGVISLCQIIGQCVHWLFKVGDGKVEGAGTSGREREQACASDLNFSLGCACTGNRRIVFVYKLRTVNKLKQCNVFLRSRLHL